MKNNNLLRDFFLFFTLIINTILVAQCSVSSQGTNVSCFGSCDGSASVSAINGSSPYSFQWSSGTTNVSAYNLCPGGYTLTVTDSKACISTASVTITEPTRINVTTSMVKQISCFGKCDGTILASASGGASYYTYSWSFGVTGATVSNLCATNYTVTATDAIGCAGYTTSPSLTEPSQLVVTTSSTPSTLIGNNGSVFVNVNGGTPVYTYSWDTGATTDTVIGLSCNVYTVTVNDANGCTGTSTSTVNCITGIDEITKEYNFKIFPNPISNSFTISELGSNSHFLIFSDLLGHIVYQTFITSSEQHIDISNYSNGIYFVEVRDEHDGSVSRKKIIKQ